MEQIKTVKNRWNRKMYRVVGIKDGKVTLERADKTQFTIVKAEYFLNYIEKRT